MTPYRIRVQRAGHRWRCRKGGWVHDLGSAVTQQQALADGLTHLDLWHHDPTARRTA